MWRVPEQRFRWADPAPYPPPHAERGDDPEASQRHLIPVGEWSRVRWRETLPLEEEPALFREFADLLPALDLVQAKAEEAILDFANRHGAIVPEDQWRPFIAVGENPSYGLNRADWSEKITPIATAVALWDAVLAADIDALKTWFLLDGDAFLFNAEHRENWPLHALFSRFGWEAVDVKLESLRGLPESDRYLRVASGLARQIAHRSLEDENVRPHLEEGPERDRLLMRLLPETLVGAMWIQFLEWVQGARSFMRCKQCARWFSISVDTKRADAAYCSAACRFRAYRWRQARAWELHSSGKVATEIARELGSDARTVRGWIRAAKGSVKRRSENGRRRRSPTSRKLG